MVRLTPSRAVRLPKRWLRSETSSAGCASAEGWSEGTAAELMPMSSCGQRSIAHRHAPGQGARRDGLGDLQLRHVDDRDVVGIAVGRVDELLVRAEGELPYPLADKQVVDDLEGLGVDHRDAVRRPEGDEAELAVAGQPHADRLQRLRPDA